MSVIDEEKPHHRKLVYGMFSLYMGQTTKYPSDYSIDQLLPKILF